MRQLQSLRLVNTIFFRILLFSNPKVCPPCHFKWASIQKNGNIKYKGYGPAFSTLLRHLMGTLLHVCISKMTSVFNRFQITTGKQSAQKNNNLSRPRFRVNDNVKNVDHRFTGRAGPAMNL